MMQHEIFPASQKPNQNCTLISVTEWDARKIRKLAESIDLILRNRLNADISFILGFPESSGNCNAIFKWLKIELENESVSEEEALRHFIGKISQKLQLEAYM